MKEYVVKDVKTKLEMVEEEVEEGRERVFRETLPIAFASWRVRGRWILLPFE